MPNIIDVSHHQGKIDWVKVVNSSFKPEGVFIKVSEGIGYNDPNLKINSTGAKSAGLKIGYYHFASLNDKNTLIDSKKEAQFFINSIKNLPKNDYPLVLDIEENKGKLSKSEVLIWINTFFYELAQNGYTDYILYSYSPFLNENLPINHKLGTVKLWIADYTEPLVLPKGWTKQWLWQYTQNGKIQGISTPVDLNR